jgi:FKBP-type peptidyl-prolyl cis-trans isomerase SlyD
MDDIKNSVSAEFVLKRQDGTLVDSSEHSGCINYIEGLGMMVPGIEKALKGRREGEEFDLVLAPEDMYGLREESNTLEVSLQDFHGQAEELEEGAIIEAHTHEGPKLMTVKVIEGDKVVLDANHPLAGMPLMFSGKLMSYRPASQEEIDSLSKSGCGCGGNHGSGESCGCGGHGHEEGGSCCSTGAGEKQGCACGQH